MSKKIGKFKIGDLVCLSSYGLQSAQNDGISEDCIGLVTSFELDNQSYPICVDWIRQGKKPISTNFFYRELKLVKK
jgi:hypothetical protein